MSVAMTDHETRDQAALLREMVRLAVQQQAPAKEQAPAAPPAPPRVARTIAVTSGKGGVGKSNLALNLATSLALMGRRVVLLDADLGTANIDVLCGLNPPLNLAHVVAGRASLREVMVQGPGGFHLIPGASGVASIAALSEPVRRRVVDQLRAVEQDADVILIDTGAGLSPNVLTFAAAADEVLVVTNPEPTSVTDAYAVIKTVLTQRGDAGLGLIVNSVRDARESRQVHERLSQVCRHFLGRSLPLAGHVVRDEAVGRAVQRRRPLMLDAPQSEAARCVSAIAHRLDRDAHDPGRAGLWDRLLRRPRKL